MDRPRDAARSRPKRFARFRYRITCDLVIAGKSHSAIVTDLSASGLFVRTRERAGSGAAVRLILHEDSGEIELNAQIVREHRMSRHHTTGIPSGLGLRITSAPEPFFRLLSGLSG